MFLRLLLLLTIIPIVELILILRVHRFVSESWGPNQALLLTVGTIVLTGLFGAKLAKVQGFLLILKARQSLAQGKIPSRAMLEGVLLVIGAATLLTPGYVTDLLGFLLLLPTTRSMIAGRLEPWLKKQVTGGRIHVHQGPARASYQQGPFRQTGGFTYTHQQGPRPSEQDEDVIDVETVEERNKRLESDRPQ